MRIRGKGNRRGTPIMSTITEVEAQELIVREHLFLAKELLKIGHHDEVDAIYNIALARAEKIYGAKSGLVGLVLIEQLDFYDHLSANDKIENNWKKLREIAVDYLEMPKRSR